MAKRKVGRPPAYDEKQVEEIKEKLIKYIDETDVPIVAEFAYTNDIPRQALYDYEQFSTLIKKLIDKKEAQLEKLGLFNVINSTMAIFSLKQLGFRDSQDINIAGQESAEPIKIKWN